MKYCHLLILSFVLFTVSKTQGTTECGVINESNDRIVHGRDVGYLKYPWFVALLLNPKKKMMCGGSLLSSPQLGRKFVVTAAHCFKPFLRSAEAGRLKLKDIYQAKLGVNNICQEESSQTEYGISKVYVHEKYQSKMPFYDIALLELDREANYTPVCLPPHPYDDLSRPKEGMIVGLGKEASNAFRLPCTVKEAQVLTWNESICVNMLNRMKEDTTNYANVFCAGYLEGRIDSCQGDSGGPLQSINPDTERYEVDGLVSFGFGCAAKGVLGVYTDVSKYLDWIQEKMVASATSETSTPSPEQQIINEILKYENKTNSYPIDDYKVVTSQEIHVAEPTTSPPVQHHRKRKGHRRRPSWAEILNW